MSKDLCWLGLSLGLTSLLWLPYVLNRAFVRGISGVVANPSPTDAPLAAWAQRAQRAHSNAVENLVVFAPAVLAAHLIGRGDGLTIVAGEIYFFSRLAHYVVYAAGIPVIRTLAFTGGWIATVIVIARVVELL